MFSERILTTFLRQLSGSQLKLEPAPKAKLPPPIPGKPYMLYAHVPFCERLCPYCSFNRYPFMEGLAHRYFARLRQEMEMVAALGYDFTSMYIGGGTPTVIVDELAATIDLARELFSIREVSTETNPNHLTPEITDALKDRVQRMSVGVQSFDNGLLKQMQRYDKYGSSTEIMARLKDTVGAYDVLNVDMIFNFPSQTDAMLEQDIACLKDSGANQTTFYPLMVSPAVTKSLSRTVGEVTYSREPQLYRQLLTGLSDTFMPSSAWAFSRSQSHLIDEYIVNYEDYVGIGSGAFSYLNGTIYVNTFSLKDYEKVLGEGKMSVWTQLPLQKRERMRYRFMMDLFGLKLDKRAFKRDFGISIERALWKELAFMRAAGAFSRDDADNLELTEKGRYLLVVMMREFFIGVNIIRDEARLALSPEERVLHFGETELCKARVASQAM